MAETVNKLVVIWSSADREVGAASGFYVPTQQQQTRLVG